MEDLDIAPWKVDVHTAPELPNAQNYQELPKDIISYFYPHESKLLSANVEVMIDLVSTPTAKWHTKSKVQHFVTSWRDIAYQAGDTNELIPGRSAINIRKCVVAELDRLVIELGISRKLEDIKMGKDTVTGNLTKEAKKILNAAVLAMEGVVTCKAMYEEGNSRFNHYTFLCTQEQASKLKDLEKILNLDASPDNPVTAPKAYPKALIKSADGKRLVTVEVLEVHDECEIDLEGEIYYKFLEYILQEKSEGEIAQEVREKLAKVMKNKRRSATREQVLAQFGITPEDVKAITTGE